MHVTGGEGVNPAATCFFLSLVCYYYSLDYCIIFRPAGTKQYLHGHPAVHTENRGIAAPVSVSVSRQDGGTIRPQGRGEKDVIT